MAIAVVIVEVVGASVIPCPASVVSNTFLVVQTTVPSVVVEPTALQVEMVELDVVPAVVHFKKYAFDKLVAPKTISLTA